MKPIKFPEANVVFAENQEEYLPLPAFVDREDPNGTVVSCWGLSLWERVKVLWSGRIYLSVLSFHQPLQPQLPAVDPPFVRRTEAEQEQLSSV
jgi:hypothetical protein